MSLTKMSLQCPLASYFLSINYILLGLEVLMNKCSVTELMPTHSRMIEMPGQNLIGMTAKNFSENSLASRYGTFTV